MAIDFVNALNSPALRAELQARSLFNGRTFTADSRIVLVLAGYTLDDITGNYLNLLKAKARRSDVEMIHVGEIVGHERGERFGHKIYSLWDTYAHADFVTYPSLWEGWGNQFIEAIRARLPILLFEYPVYRSDIQDKGFQVVSLGSEIPGYDNLGLVELAPEKIRAAADQAVILLTDAEKRAKVVEHNYRIGKQYYSIEALRRHLAPLVNIP
jgi:glycosyltransferase involved in cell wall biosynthesis